MGYVVAKRRGLVFSTAIKTFFLFLAIFPFREDGLNVPWRSSRSRFCPSKPTPTTSLYPCPPPLADHMPRPLGLFVIHGECGPRAQVGCLKRVSHRRLRQGKARRALFAKSELPCRAPSGLGSSRGPRPGGWASGRGGLPKQPEQPRSHWVVIANPWANDTRCWW